MTGPDRDGLTRELPNVEDPETAGFWAAARNGEVAVQACLPYGHLRWPPEPVCPVCQSAETEWRPVRPSGAVWSYAVYHRALSAAHRDDVPYAIGLIELDDGLMMYGRLPGGAHPPEIGTRVHAVFEAASDEVTFVRWVPDLAS